MNKTEHLLACLAEECAEVIQAVGKALRFGLDDGYPGSNKTNADDILHELIDAFAVTELLRNIGAFPVTGTIIEIYEKIEAKKKRVEEMMNYAVRNGTLVE